MKGDREKYLAAGFDAYVSKPINPTELKAAIDSRITGNAAGAAPKPAPDFDTADDILNLSEALARVEGNRDLLTKIARVFLELYPKLIEESHEAVSRADCKMLARAARALASSARQLGAQRACVSARKVEELGRHGELAQLPVALAELDSELRLVASAITDHSSPHYLWLHSEA
jgi:HPt (histidine-containing phosphotransfer) domain-containing protein